MRHLPHHRLWHWLRKTCLHKGMMDQLSLLAISIAFALPIPQAQAALGIETPPREPGMLWPLLPGESLQSLAVKLYPQSPILQQRFIQQALSFSRHRGILLQADAPTQRAQLIAVPDAGDMHTVTRRIKKAEELTADTVDEKLPGLVMSMQISGGPVAPLPAPPLLSRLHWREIHWPSVHLPTLETAQFDQVKKSFLTRSEHWLKHGQQAIQPVWQQVKKLGVQAAEHYQANARAIAQTPLRAIYQHPQQAIILGCAVWLLVLSLVWGVLETRRD
ncbi:hypothetical protein [Methylophilus aquaticus]|uniref:Uncharacterized protein n=1 Tax=Methylophilus aquaticus TaxID=1971610 RepID=A0ABT9JNX4_9PROT|nr:hypothetical protein [Methylophilus aquaticus]MDP8566288.1 hypothetical protein [Methylophilus aquaticus]